MAWCLVKHLKLLHLLVTLPPSLSAELAALHEARYALGSVYLKESLAAAKPRNSSSNSDIFFLAITKSLTANCSFSHYKRLLSHHIRGFEELGILSRRLFLPSPSNISQLELLAWNRHPSYLLSLFPSFFSDDFGSVGVLEAPKQEKQPTLVYRVREVHARLHQPSLTLGVFWLWQNGRGQQWG